MLRQRVLIGVSKCWEKNKNFIKSSKILIVDDPGLSITLSRKRSALLMVTPQPNWILDLPDMYVCFFDFGMKKHDWSSTKHQVIKENNEWNWILKLKSKPKFLSCIWGLWSFEDSLRTKIYCKNQSRFTYIFAMQYPVYDLIDISFPNLNWISLSWKKWSRRVYIMWQSLYKQKVLEKPHYRSSFEDSEYTNVINAHQLLKDLKFWWHKWNIYTYRVFRWYMVMRIYEKLIVINAKNFLQTQV